MSFEEWYKENKNDINALLFNQRNGLHVGGYFKELFKDAFEQGAKSEEK